MGGSSKEGVQAAGGGQVEQADAGAYPAAGERRFRMGSSTWPW